MALDSKHPFETFFKVIKNGKKNKVPQKKKKLHVFKILKHISLQLQKEIPKKETKIRLWVSIKILCLD